MGVLKAFGRCSGAVTGGVAAVAVVVLALDIGGSSKVMFPGCRRILCSILVFFIELVVVVEQKVDLWRGSCAAVAGLSSGVEVMGCAIVATAEDTAGTSLG